MKCIQKILVVVAGALVSLVGATSQGKTITAAGCLDIQVQAAIDQATNGDTVVIPPGTAIWTNQVTICRKSVLLKGSGINVTTLIDGQAANRSCLFVGFSTNRFVNVSDMTLVGSTNSPNTRGWIMVGDFFADINLNFRIHHLYFTNNVRTAIAVYGWGEGCIDHCRVECAPGNYSPTGVQILGDGDRAWSRPYKLGTTNTVCVEDCSFFWPTGQANAAMDAYGGARWVFRFNNVTNTSMGCHGLDSGGYRSPHSFEFYGNHLNIVGSNRVAWQVEIRGGTGVIYSNTSVSAYPYVQRNISLLCYRATGSNAPAPGIYPPWGPITGTNPIDQNLDKYGYPAHDQVGFTTPAYVGGPQVSAPCYGWSNTVNGADLPLGVVRTSELAPYFLTNHPTAADILKEGRDFTNHVVMPGYTPLVYPHPMVTANL